jgi:hypothetical protein
MDRTIIFFLTSLRAEMKKSRFKIWLRAVLFVQFAVLFAFYFDRDIANGYFTWIWVATLFMLFIPVGFWMSRLVPMKVDHRSKAVTLSLDRIYLVLIWVLVIIKLIASYIHRLIPVSDVIMCAILGIMCGRLGGIGLRVRYLKMEHGFLPHK